MRIVTPAEIACVAWEGELILRYLHLSDLHLTYQETGGENWAVDQFNQDMVTRSMVDAIKELVQHKPLDMILITGDLAKRGKREEYQVVDVFCERLLDVTGVPASRLYLVPGNHDVDRSKVDERHIKWWYRFEEEDDITGVLSSDEAFPVLMRKFAAFNDFATRAMNRRLYMTMSIM